MVSLFLNDINVSQMYGIYLGENALTTLLCPPPVKSYIENKSANNHGKEILIGSEGVKIDERDITLEFIIAVQTESELETSYINLLNILQSGKVVLRAIKGDYFNSKNELYYLSCSTLQTYFRGKAKFMVKFNEPKPIIDMTGFEEDMPERPSIGVDDDA